MDNIFFVGHRTVTIEEVLDSISDNDFAKSLLKQCYTLHFEQATPISQAEGYEETLLVISGEDGIRFGDVYFENILDGEVYYRHEVDSLESISNRYGVTPRENYFRPEYCCKCSNSHVLVARVFEELENYQLKETLYTRYPNGMYAAYGPIVYDDSIVSDISAVPVEVTELFDELCTSELAWDRGIEIYDPLLKCAVHKWTEVYDEYHDMKWKYHALADSVRENVEVQKYE